VGRELPEFGPPREWYAVGRPDPWGAWTVEPTGRDAEASVAFTVPESRGTASTVAIIVDGGVAREYDARGGQEQRISVGGNDGPHSVALRVCNEFGRCSEAPPQTVQTYGPLRSDHILSVQPEQNGYQVRWVVTVDANGDPAQVRVQGSTGRDVTLEAPGIDVQTVYTGWLDLGPSTTEAVTVSLGDPNPNRGYAQKVATTRTPDPTPHVQISRGAACSDGSPTPCQSSPSDPTCVNNCAFLALAWSDSYATMTCAFDSNLGELGEVTIFGSQGSTQTNRYFGNFVHPGGSELTPEWVNVRCDSELGSGESFSEMNW
jgi:hypothetical protein